MTAHGLVVPLPGVARQVTLPVTEGRLDHLETLPARHNHLDWCIRATRHDLLAFLRPVVRRVHAALPAGATRLRLMEALLSLVQSMTYRDVGTNGLHPGRTWDTRMGVCIDTAVLGGGLLVTAGFPAALRFFTAADLGEDEGHVALLVGFVPGIRGTPWIVRGVPYYLVETTAEWRVGAIPGGLDVRGKVVPLRPRARLTLQRAGADWWVTNSGSRASRPQPIVIDRHGSEAPFQVVLPAVPVDGCVRVPTPPALARQGVSVRFVNRGVTR